MIHDYFAHDTLHLTATGVIAKSSNIGTVLAATQIPSEDLYRLPAARSAWARTEVGLDGETTASCRTGRPGGRSATTTVAFGQGLIVNTLQMAAAINTVANGGVLVTPEPGRGVRRPPTPATTSARPHDQAPRDHARGRARRCRG